MSKDFCRLHRVLHILMECKDDTPKADLLMAQVIAWWMFAYEDPERELERLMKIARHLVPQMKKVADLGQQIDEAAKENEAAYAGMVRRPPR